MPEYNNMKLRVEIKVKKIYMKSTIKFLYKYHLGKKLKFICLLIKMG